MRRFVLGTLVAAVLAVVLACEKSPTTPAVDLNPNHLPYCLAEPRHVAPTDRVPCPSRAEIDQINHDIPITFAGGSTTGSLVCRQADGSADLTYAQALAYVQIAYMRRMVFHTPLPWTDADLYTWFRSAIAGIVVETGSDGSWCCSPSRVIHMVYPVPGASPSISFPASPAIMVHEARHAEHGPHTCIMSKDATHMRTGDYTIAEMGASGVEYLLLEWLAKYSDEPQGLKDFFAWCAWGIRNQYMFCNECFRPPS